MCHWLLSVRCINLLIHLLNACRGELPCGSQPTAPACVVWGWRLKGALHPPPPRQWMGEYIELLILSMPDVYAMLMRPNKAETVSCPWLPLLGLYGCAHVLGTDQTVGWWSSVSLALIVWFIFILSKIFHSKCVDKCMSHVEFFSHVFYLVTVCQDEKSHSGIFMVSTKPSTSQSDPSSLKVTLLQKCCCNRLMFLVLFLFYNLLSFNFTRLVVLSISNIRG